MSTDVKTIQFQIHYHSTDEVVLSQEAELTLAEMRAFMVWMSSQTVAGFPSTNCAVGANKVFQLMRDTSNRIEDHKHGGLNPLDRED